MATEDMWSVLEDCVKKINDNTAHPENFLSLQDGAAADFTTLTKLLYDLHKTEEPAEYKGSPLVQLVVENFDEEQIWQELELQNNAVMTHFENATNEALSDEKLSVLVEEEDDEENSVEAEGETHDDDDEEEEEEENDDDDDDDDDEPPKQSKRMAQDEDGAEGYTDEDSDLDFDVDALEKREKQKKEIGRKGSRPKVVPSEVDDTFFKLSEMESFLDDMDKREGKEDENENELDYFQDLPSDDDDDLDLNDILSAKKKKKIIAKSSRNLKYKDFFDAVDREPGGDEDHSDGEEDNKDKSWQEGGEEIDEEADDYDGEEESDAEDEETKAAQKKVTFNLNEDSEGEDLADIFGGKTPSSAISAVKSSFEKRQEKMSEKIEELEKTALADKPWQLSGEITSQSRPENSMLEEDVEFEQTGRMAPSITAETTLQLEDIIKQRIKDQAFDDVVRKEKPKEEVFDYKKKLALDHEKSKQSLAEIYEQEYLKQNQQKTEEEENSAHVEIQKLMDTLFLKLDALSNFHFTPKPPVPEVKVVSNLPSVTMEEVAPVSASDAMLLAPEEIKEKNKAGDILGDTEKTSTDKMRDRRHKKTVKRIKIKEKEKRQKLKEASGTGENRKLSKAEVAENLKKLTKGGKTKILKDEGKDKALRSSQAFFSELQDQVKSQIKSAKDPSSKKKKHKEVSVSKLKL